MQCELDPQATDDLMQSLDPGHWFDLGTLYDELNQTLVRAGVLAAPAAGASKRLRAAAAGCTSPVHQARVVNYAVPMALPLPLMRRWIVARRQQRPHRGGRAWPRLRARWRPMRDSSCNAWA